MASKSIRWITALIITSTWCLATAAAPARAASIDGSTSPKPNHFKFYLDPDLLSDPQFAKAVLPKYVADLNSVLAKNTNRQLAFNAQTDILATMSKPQTDTASSPLPTDGFEIWVYAVPSTSAAYGPYAGVDASGAAVLSGLKWSKLYDPDALTSSQEVQDYTGQLNTMLHEMAHVFGAGVGEYYSLARVLDGTQTEPLQNISLANATDAYWSDKPDFMPDPLLQFTRATTRAGYLAQVRYSALTASVISGSYRNGVPSVSQFTVKVTDRNGQAVAGAEVKVWNVVARSPYSSQLLWDVLTDQGGQATLAWGGTGLPHNSSNMLRLIKVYKDGAPLTLPRYVSVFDADVARLVRQSALVVTMQQVNHAPTDLQLTNGTIDENLPAGTAIGELSGTDADAGDTLVFTLCGELGDAAFSIAGSSLLSAMSFDYETQNSYTACVEASDGNGGTLQKSFVVTVNDLQDTSQHARFRSQDATDGWVLESARDSGKGGSANATTRAGWLGFDSKGREYRSVLSFDTSALPDNAVVTGITLRVKLQTAPAEKRSILVDVRKAFLGTSPSLQLSDYQAQATMAGGFNSDPLNGWYTVQLDGAALSQVNPTGRTQFRLRIEPEATAGSSLMSIYTGGALITNRPQLSVEYTIP